MEKSSNVIVVFFFIKGEQCASGEHCPIDQHVTASVRTPWQVSFVEMCHGRNDYAERDEKCRTDYTSFGGVY